MNPIGDGGNKESTKFQLNKEEKGRVPPTSNFLKMSTMREGGRTYGLCVMKGNPQLMYAKVKHLKIMLLEEEVSNNGIELGGEEIIWGGWPMQLTLKSMAGLTF